MTAPTVPADDTVPARPLLDWYARHRRALPWRAPSGAAAIDPYRVWLSEIMLQQTTVAAVAPYYARFLARFPDIEALARAPEAEVLGLWSGLGYYARGRNLHRCARAVADAGGRFPADIAALERLPGIGRYTARAIAAIAFAIPAVPVDGNVERVVARLRAVDTPLPAARPALDRLATALGDDPDARRAPSDFAQALFDLGATICTPRRPACALCPWRPHCAGHRAGFADTLPRRAARPARPLRHGALFWLVDPADHVLLRQRPPRGPFAGMSEPFGTPWRSERWGRTEAIALSAPMRDLEWRPAGTVRHSLTHLELAFDVFAAVAPHPLDPPPPDGFLRPRAALAAEPLPTVMRRAAALGDAALAAPFPPVQAHPIPAT